MAQYQSHISFSIILAIAYAVLGIFYLNVYPEHVVLASVIVVIAGMLPNVDSSGGTVERELAGFIAAISPLVAIELYPHLKDGGIARIALVVICCYLLTRMVLVRSLQKYTVHRGMVHSVPAAIITFQLAYLLFWDLFWKDRVYIAFAAFLGFFSHLMLDAYGNVDIVGKAMGKAERKKPVLKFGAGSFGSTLAVYACVAILAWFILRDFYPRFRVLTEVRY